MKKKNLLFILGFTVVLIAGLYFYFNLYLPSREKTTNNPFLNRDINIDKAPTIKPTAHPKKTLSVDEERKISQAKTLLITVKSGGFTPSEISIKAYDQLIWKNDDTVDHIVKGEDWGGVVLKPGSKMVKVFAKPGSYPYSCTLHPGETGEIIVE